MDRAWFVLGPEVEAFEREFAAASRRAARGRRGQRNRRARVDPSRARHRRRRRSRHDAALGRVHGDRDCDGGRAPGVCRHRSRAADAGPGVPPSGRSPRRTARPAPGALVRPARGYAGIRGPRQPEEISRSSKTAARRISRRAPASRSAPSAPRAHSASILRRISARSAMAARS